MPLSVLSALIRLDIDPWEEAKRLSILPSGIAASALAPIIARLPGGQWQLSETQKIAERLIALLPQCGVRAKLPRTGHKAVDSNHCLPAGMAHPSLLPPLRHDKMHDQMDVRRFGPFWRK